MRGGNLFTFYIYYIGYRVHGWGMPIECDGELFYMMEDVAIIALEN